LYLIVKGMVQGSIGLVRAVTGRLGRKQAPAVGTHATAGLSTVARPEASAGKGADTPTGSPPSRTDGAKRPGSARIQTKKARSVRAAGGDKRAAETTVPAPAGKVSGEDSSVSHEVPVGTASPKKGRRGIRLKGDLNEH
jgi:hypothetical protein